MNFFQLNQTMFYYETIFSNAICIVIGFYQVEEAPIFKVCVYYFDFLNFQTLLRLSITFLYWLEQNSLAKMA